MWFVNVLVSAATNFATGDNMLGALIVAALAGLLFLYVWHRSRVRDGKRGVEPWHLIVGGMLGVVVFAMVALGGVIWQSKVVKSETATVVASKPPATTEKISDFEWGFERTPGYYFIGMSPDPDQKLLVHFFQAQGHNRTGDPLTKVDGYVRSDRTGQKYPIYFNVPPGATRASPSEINAIPVDAIMDVRAPFLPNDGLMPMKQFLAEIVPFTFFFEYDGKTYRRAFSVDDIEPLIRQYEQDIRKSSVKPPQMSRKQIPGDPKSITPRQLLALYEGKTPLQADKLLQPYKGTLIESEGAVLTILSDGGGGGVIGVLRNDQDTIECRFGVKWRDELSSKGKGENVRFRGIVSDNQNGSQLYVSNCEII